jgi:hypothetical protein
LTLAFHVLSVIFFELRGMAVAGYDVQLPGSGTFQQIPDGLSDTPRLGGAFISSATLTLAADDRGGSGIATIRWSLNGSAWQTAAGSMVRIDLPSDGVFQVRYQAIDAAGNEGPVRELTVRVDSKMAIHRVTLPLVMR